MKHYKHHFQKFSMTPSMENLKKKSLKKSIHVSKYIQKPFQ